MKNVFYIVNLQCNICIVLVKDTYSVGLQFPMGVKSEFGGERVREQRNIKIKWGSLSGYLTSCQESDMHVYSSPSKEGGLEGKDIAQWKSVCLAYMSSWVQSPVLLLE